MHDEEQKMEEEKNQQAAVLNLLIPTLEVLP